MHAAEGAFRVCFTGHRPNGLGGYDEHQPSNAWVKDALDGVVLGPQAAGASSFISGMALGTDTWGAEAVLHRKAPLLAALPFAGQDGRWPPAARQRYRDILARAVDVVTVSTGGYALQKMHQRNQYMVDEADLVVAVWNGQRRGGTWNCVDYATGQGKAILHVDPVQRSIRLLRH